MKKITIFLSVFLSLFIFTACNTEKNNKVDLSLFNNVKEWRLSSYESGTEVSTEHYLKQKAPYDDKYKFETNLNTSCKIYDSDGDPLLELEPSTKGSLNLKKDDIVYVVLNGLEEKTIGYEVELEEHKSLLPYDPINLVNAESLLSENKSNA
jgi:hypothetical protein